MRDNWIPRRSIQALLAPTVLLLAGIALPSVEDAVPKQIQLTMDGGAYAIDRGMLVWAGAAMAAWAIGLELRIQKQLRLARSARTVQGIVDNVGSVMLGPGRRRAHYRFCVIPGHWIKGSGVMDPVTAAAVDRGSAVEIAYDPDNPERNMMTASLWAIRWVIPVEQRYK